MKRGVAAGLGRPTPAKRLSAVDRKWLQRCQVFGELCLEERPAAGNQEMKPEERREENRKEEGSEDDRGGKTEADMKTVRVLEAPQLQTQETGGDGNQRMEEQTGGELLESVTPDLDRNLNSNKTQRGGRKRQREEDVLEEGGQEKKKQRRRKKKDEGPHVPPREEETTKKKEERSERPHEVRRDDLLSGLCGRILPSHHNFIPFQPFRENLLGEVQEEFEAKMFRTPSAKPR